MSSVVGNQFAFEYGFSVINRGLVLGNIAGAKTVTFPHN